MEQIETGSWVEWEGIWKNANKTNGLPNILFTKGEAKSIYQFWHKGYANDLLKLLPSQKNIKLLELGSGRGTTSMYLADNGFTDITLVDLSKEGLAQAIDNFTLFQLPKPKIRVADVRNTELKSESYDCVYNIGLLEHFENPVPVLKEAKRLLKKGGMIFMPVVPRYSFWRGWRIRVLLNPLSVLKHFVKQIFGLRKMGNPDMVRTSNDGDQYIKFLEEAGFEHVSVLPYNPYWKINKDGSWWESYFTLPIYNWHYKVFSINKDISLASRPKRNVCLYLVAST